MLKCDLYFFRYNFNNYYVLSIWTWKNWTSKEQITNSEAEHIVKQKNKILNSRQLHFDASIFQESNPFVTYILHEIFCISNTYLFLWENTKYHNCQIIVKQLWKGHSFFFFEVVHLVKCGQTGLFRKLIYKYKNLFYCFLILIVSFSLRISFVVLFFMGSLTIFNFFIIFWTS